MEEGLSEKEREHGSKGGRETSREVVYSQTNHSLGAYAMAWTRCITGNPSEAG